MKKLTLLMVGIFIMLSSCQKDTLDSENENINSDDETFENPDITCEECDGKINALELKFNGDVSAQIRVETKNVGENGSKIVFNEYVESEDNFNFIGNDNKGTLGTEISIFIDDLLNTKLHTSCSIPVGPGLIFGDFEVIWGTSRNGGELCPLDDSTSSPAEDCNDCDGKINYMDLIYNGSQGATITVETKRAGIDGSKIVFNEFVAPGGTFDFSGNDNKGTLGTAITIFIDGVKNTELHTSCSVPVGPGLVFGSFEVLSATSRNGGELCPIESTNTTPPDSACPCNGNVVQMVLIYDGPANTTVSIGIQSDGSDALQVFTNVQTGDILNVSMGDVGDWWYFSVDGVVDASINTSCADVILGNEDATLSDFGNLGVDFFPNPSQNHNNATFFVYSHTDSSGNACTAVIG
ncbi:DUF7467 domain-containing protein [Winogradskyella flava]|uniref:DUF7467 domain-containing protein n=1 Tax=Winogradskyella flava TaxID=1884876 RepID=UPI002490999A|nr:hypothetical protein [Winogradskyella flava]